MLVHAISEDFHKLLENSGLTSITLLCEARRVMVVAEDITFVLVVRVGSTEDGRANAAREVLDVIFPVERSNV